MCVKGTRTLAFSILTLKMSQCLFNGNVFLGNVLLCNYLTRSILGPILDTFESPSLIKKKDIFQPGAMELSLLSIILQLVTERRMAFPLYLAAPDLPLTVLLLSVCS